MRNEFIFDYNYIKKIAILKYASSNLKDYSNEY